MPTEWSSYAKWEQSLEALKSKRCKRLKIRHLNSAHAGQGRVLAIYERAVNRHPQSGELWREYLAYTANVKATKRWRKTMTNALRMNPTDHELWVMAGRRAARNGDMASSRGFFMRGCRFCNKECGLWVEYARSEMEWLAKVDKRKAKPGKAAKDPLRPDRVDADDELRIEDSDEGEDEDNELPVPSRAQAKAIDEQESEQLKSNPAMDGAIPIAIFDISRKQAFFKPEVAEVFYVMLGGFRDVSVQPKVAQHVLNVMEEQFPDDPATCSCYIRQPILGLSPHTADFPSNLRTVLGRLTEKLESTTDRTRLAQKTAAWIDEYLALEDLDDGIRAVLELTKNKVV